MNRPILSRGKGWLPLTAAVVLLAAITAALWFGPPAANPANPASPAAPAANPASVAAPAANPANPAAPAGAPQAAIPEPPPSPTPALVTPPGTEPAPDFRGIAAWLNSPPLAMAELRGQVVLVDIWTYS